MHRTTVILVALALLGTSTPAPAEVAAAAVPEMAWWYRSPARKYWEGLPIGTGRFAAMVLGKVDQEAIPFNDETIWSGGPYNPNNPDGPKILAQVRQLVLAKDYVAATEEAKKLASRPLRVQHYQPMGVLNLSFDGHDQARVTNYTRTLSMDRATVTVSYTLDGVDFEREIFASYPDQVLVMRLTASRPASVNVKAWLGSLQQSARTHVSDGDIVMRGTTTELTQPPYNEKPLPPKIRWQSRLKVIADGGKLSHQKSDAPAGDQIQVAGADSVTVLLAGATNWKDFDDVSGDEVARCDRYIENAGSLGYARLKQRHLDDYVPLFASCRLDLGGHDAARLDTTERMRRLRADPAAQDPLFVSQYFQFGRYLLLAAARENTLAFNNHNIWLDNTEGRWQGRWTLNINLQECYWPVENTNLPRVNDSLLRFAESLARAGARTAKELYGCRGWVAHHGTDVWFNTAPTDPNPRSSTWPMAGAWIMQQLYDHYAYEPDEAYLRRIYPLLRGSAEFYLDFLMTDPATGWLVTCPSTSPENDFFSDGGKAAAVSMGSAMDAQLLRKLFRNCLEATRTLKVDDEFAARVEQALGKLPPHQIGRHGQLQEWLYDFREVEEGHRHISHLFAAYPDDDITPRKTPELADAVRVVLRRRGDINRGWSGAWKINQHARLDEPDAAYQILRAMLTEVSLHPRPEDSDVTPSFEGNQGIQGFTAGVAEMLMQSHSGEIVLLPALPKAWPTGKITGLRARGGYLVDIDWRDHALREAKLVAKFSGPCKLRLKAPAQVTADARPVRVTESEGHVHQFDAVAGSTYVITPR